METKSHVPLLGSRRVPLPGARALKATNPNATIHVLVKLRGKSDPGHMKGRPSKHLSRKELSEGFGSSPEDIQKTVKVFEALGLKEIARHPESRSVKFSGTVAQMESAFQVKLFDYEHPAGNYRGRVGEVHIPAELKGIVQAVFGLDNRRVARRKPPLPGKPMDLAKAAPHVFLPAQLAARYNYPPGDGSGQTIGLLEFGGGYFPSDLEKFCKAANVSVPKVTTISVDGTATNARDGAEGEVMLDVEVVAGVCPKANIVVYFAQFTEMGWVQILDEAIHDSANNPSVLSVSWGYAEDANVWTTQGIEQVNKSLQDAAMVGLTVCVAAGDDGSSDGILDGHAHVDFPASSPYVLAVGGTTIPPTGPDICWREGDGLRQDGGGCTGGGSSVFLERPSWQESIAIQSVNPGGPVGRIIPDIAANADWTASPYLLVVDGQGQPNGGTSAASPLVGSLILLINGARKDGSKVGYVTPLLYQAAGAGETVGSGGCTDVVSGINITSEVGGYQAGPGFDAVSGWGTPSGAKLMELLNSASASAAAV
jgi:kumamolisin